uniref:Solute carrier family 15 member 5 n=1 Tax=Geotrypetes seraphini TaxID=260995 RepID=A0A6P8RQ94_GEOSA|nr:solute carrier family 15 member 5 [Geotrypetes seraphini]
MAVTDLASFQEKRLNRASSERKGRKFLRNDTRQSKSPGSSSKNKAHVMICLLLVEFCERFAFFGIVCNTILFCTIKLGYQNHQAATVNLCFIGASTLMPVFVGWFAESCMGRIKVVYICIFLHFIGTAMLPVVAFPFEDFYLDTHHAAHTLAKREQNLLFYIGLLATSLGTGGIRAIICPLGAYSLQDRGQKELLSFFNWFYWLVNLNSLIVFLGIAYIQQSVAKNLGFLIPFVSVIMALITIHMIRNELIYQPRKGSSLFTAFGVFANALRMCCVWHRHLGGQVSSWLDRAKENNGGCYSEAHVESTRSLVRLLPFFGFQVLYRTCVMQIPSGYYIQTMNSNLNLEGFLLPIAAMNAISIAPLLLLAPLLEGISASLLVTGRGRMVLSSYIIAGHICASLSMLVAGCFEMLRKHFSVVEQTLSGKVLLVSSMPCYHLAPQYVLLGLAEALVTPACSVITFRFVPSRIRGISMHFLTIFNGAGCFMGAFIVQAVHLISGGVWFPDVLAEGHLQGFFFFLASLLVLNTLAFWRVSPRYNNLDEQTEQGVKGSLLEEKLLQHEKSLKFYDSIWESSSTFTPLDTAL